MRIMHKISERLGVKIKENGKCTIKRVLFVSVWNIWYDNYNLQNL